MALTDAQFIAWLKSADSIRTVLVEVAARVSGSETTLYLASRPYTDAAAGRTYSACIAGGLSTRESISLDGSPSIGWGDIEVHNESGERDAWLDYIWAGRTASVYVGDPTWPRADFRQVFAGVVDDIAVAGRSRLQLRLRDKLDRLNAPVTEAVLGGTSANKDRLLPLTFGEAFNVEPLLTNPSTLEYQWHAGAAERLIEVRDNGAPITSYTTSLATGKFTLTAAPVGQITASVQGAKPGGTYANTVSALVQHIVTSYGPSTTRLSAGDLDATQLAAFASACPQAVGVYVAERTNVLALCQQLAASVGASVVMSSTGLLRLVRLALPASGTPTAVTAADMAAGTLTISQRPPVRASCKLGYSPSFAVQTSGLATGLPASSVQLLGQDAQTVTVTDSTVATVYKLDGQPVREETLLLDETEATTEATRRRDLWATQRAIYTARYLPHLLLTELGDAVTLTHERLGLAAGKTGLVVSIERDWLAGRITLGVLA